jgi:hypothetical protein
LKLYDFSITFLVTISSVVMIVLVDVDIVVNSFFSGYKSSSEIHFLNNAAKLI